MSFAEKVAALRSFFGVSKDEPLAVAVGGMNRSMGIDGEGPLPKQVDALVSATGVTVAPAADAGGRPSEARVDVGVPVDAEAPPATAPPPSTAPGPSMAPGPSTAPGPFAFVADV
jgi:hypothetical protein